MIQLLVGNSYSRAMNLDKGSFALLRKLLSYKVGSLNYQGAGFGPRTKYLIDVKGNFPTGVLRKVGYALAEADIDFDIQDTRERPTSPGIHLSAKELYPAYPSQRDALAASLRNFRGGIVMPTGSGKSRVIGMIGQARGLKTLVVVPTLEIKKQLEVSLKETYGPGFSKIFTVENIDSSALQKTKGFDVLIIDECHHAAARTYQRLNKSAWQNIYYRYFLSATYFRNEAEQNLAFEGITGEVIYELSQKEAVDAKYIVPVEASYVDVPKTPSTCQTWAQVYSTLIVNNKARNDLVAKTAYKMANKMPTLVLVKEIRHGEILAGLTGAPFVNGQDEDSRIWLQHFNDGKLPLLIGTTGVLGEGVDTKPAECVIIAGLGKARSAFLQQVGRGVRNYKNKETCKVILFKDQSHKFTARHFNAQKAILKEDLGVSIKVLIP